MDLLHPLTSGMLCARFAGTTERKGKGAKGRRWMKNGSGREKGKRRGAKGRKRLINPEVFFCSFNLTRIQAFIRTRAKNGREIHMEKKGKKPLNLANTSVNERIVRGVEV